MSEENAQVEQFTGLILVTGVDRPGLAASLFESLSPFTLFVIDVEQIVINHRLILTLLIGANPAHQGAIEDDLTALATALDVDIATIFSKTMLMPLPLSIVRVVISAPKLHPREIALVTQSLHQLGCNIERFERLGNQPTSISITVSGAPENLIKSALAGLTFDTATTVALKQV